MRATITIGISGSGKSTWAEQQPNTYVISRDNFRTQILCERHDFVASKNMWSLWKFDKEDEKLVTAMVREVIEDMALRGRDIVIADTNLNAGRNATLKGDLEALGYEVEFKYFDIDLMEAIKRDERRKDTVGAEVIRNQWKQYVELTDQKVRFSVNLHSVSSEEITYNRVVVDGFRKIIEANYNYAFWKYGLNFARNRVAEYECVKIATEALKELGYAWEVKEYKDSDYE